MTDEALTAPAIDAVQPSQIIHDTGTDPNAQGKGVHVPEGEDQKAEAKPSTRDAIAKAFDEAEAKSKAEAEDKAKVDDTKPVEAKEDVKPEKEEPAKAEKEIEAKADKGEAEKPAAERADETRQSEGRRYTEPPARFLPDARTKWANVPNEVKAEMHRVSEEFERELSEHKQFREELREYEELSKQHNVTIKGTLDRYVAADRELNQDFGRGVAQLMQMYGHDPVHAVASILRAQGLTPQQYAQHVMQNPQAHQAPIQQPQAQAQSAPDPQVSALAQELNSLKSQLATAQVTPTIERFAAEHPDYHALESKIAEVLKSGVIEQLYGAGLSPEQKLAEAYRMAGGRSSSPDPDLAAAAHDNSQPEAPARLVDPDGRKSITGAPTAGQTGQPKWVPKSNREALERAFASVR